MRKQITMLWIGAGLFGSLLVLGNHQIFANTEEHGSNHVYSFPENVTDQDYLPKTVVIKIKPYLKPYCGQDQISISSLQRYFTKIGMVNL